MKTGAFALESRRVAQSAAHGACRGDGPEEERPSVARTAATTEANCAHHRPVRLSWAKLLKRVFASDLELPELQHSPGRSQLQEPPRGRRLRAREGLGKKKGRLNLSSSLLMGSAAIARPPCGRR